MVLYATIGGINVALRQIESMFAAMLADYENRNDFAIMRY